MARQALEVMLSDPRSPHVHACVCLCVRAREGVQAGMGAAVGWRGDCRGVRLHTRVGTWVLVHSYKQQEKGRGAGTHSGPGPRPRPSWHRRAG